MSSARSGCLVAFALALAAVGCGRTNQLRARMSGVETRAKEAQQRGAMKCAPRELALAQAYLEFADIELSKGHGSDAAEHVARAELNVNAALLQTPSESCLPRSGALIVPQPGDRDGDGFLDGDDRCPDQPENFDGLDDLDGCPDDADTDGDRVANSVDACPLLPEDVDGYLDADGCPDDDNDADGLLDAADKCPNDPEDPDEYEDSDGCPEPDNDGDTALDVDDECPNTPGQLALAPRGCPIKPALVVVTDCEVKITQQIHFSYNKAVIAKESFAVLDAVVDVLAKNPAIRLEVEGHTDDKGSDSYNKTLSDQRAQSVRKYLVSHGVAVDRMSAHGYGEERPLVANNSDANRSLNRRVQFMRTEGTSGECTSGGQVPADPASSPR
ncbi:MAG TPA: OmpA family protein [Polyangiaceae bacterium]|nr:OmpA family protein [Polyangiaceae bacterium]